MAMEHLLFLDDFFHVFSTETSLFSCGGFPMLSHPIIPEVFGAQKAVHLTGPHGGVESDDIHFLGFTQKA